ncbi:MFS transporter [Nocardioides marmoribigeumensis]|uniref:MFS family permease n=1 Tax=Nocardioides marmoribigeumensis TaxID=433649 RepID=A0ABU2BUL3_9ACTN|nr:MFS transporter [Nocardioides marmoribigeumensis]MDR7361946.1 MFS family permease [Nocardioides marmoribigeumensis]
MTTYTSLLRLREFRALFGAQAANVLAGSLAGLALATLVDRATGSPLLTALAVFAPTLANVLGAATAMSLADGRSPRAAVVALQAAIALGLLAQALPGLPLWARFALLLLMGLLSSVSGGIRTAVMSEVVGIEAYARARSLLNVSVGVMQVAGYALGAGVLAAVGPSRTFLLAAGLAATSTLTLRLGVRRHSVRAAVRPSLRQTATTNAWLARQRPLRPVLLALWVPNGLVVGCEALFVPYAGERGGWLFMAAAVGMLAGDLVVGRVLTPAWRARVGPWLRLQLAVPFLFFALSPGLPVAMVLAAVACVGYAATLPLQELLLVLTPDRVRGQVQGVEQAGRMTCQGLGAVLAGTVAEVVPVGTAMGVMAVLSVLVTLAVMPGVARSGRSLVEQRDLGGVDEPAGRDGDLDEHHGDPAVEEPRDEAGQVVVGRDPVAEGRGHHDR